MAQRKPELISEGPITFLKLLSKEKIPFIIIGGAALALHGIPRSTLDIDIFLPAHRDLIVRLLAISKKLKFNCEQKDIVRFIDRPALLIGQLITFKDSKGNELIDVFLEDPKSFSRLLKRATRKKTEYFTLNVASLDDLEQMKKKSSRPIDLADIALIQERRRYI